MAASGSGVEAARPWTATSTWAPAGGAAVEDAVSFETTDVDAEESPAGVVLTRPPPDESGDAPPCEVTVSFRGMYEIHRVYVKSTARIYEIYHSTKTKSTSKDYLCTVRCGLVIKEPQPTCEENVDQWNYNASTSEKREHETKSISSSSSDDSWVDVKVPESPMEKSTPESQESNVAGTCQEKNLAHYEATAEMTDVSPCISLTVRLLSLQSKTSVHIEEIYIFADPVETTNDDSVTGPGNMGGSSLLAMLVPGLMQMSKSRNYKIDDAYFSHGSRSQPTQDHAVLESSPYEKIAQEAGPCGTDDTKYRPAGTEMGIDSAYGGTVSSEKSNQVQLQFKDPVSVRSPAQTTENAQVPSVKDQLVSDKYQLPDPLMNGNFTPYNHIERKLDTLLSKVEKMELYCSRFEDNMIKPLSSIEARLQRLEQQFDSFSVEIQSLRDSSARMSAPDGVYDTNSQEVHNDGNSRTIADRKPGLCFRAPEFSSEDSCDYNVTDGNQVDSRGPNMVPRLLVKVPELIVQLELTSEKLHEGPFSPVHGAISSEQKERKTSPGLVVKVPEFPDDDDDDEVGEEKKAEVDDQYDGTEADSPCSNTVDNSKSKNRVSVNGALASALEALLMSTTGISSSNSVVCSASNGRTKITNGSSSCSLSLGNVDEMSTKDVSVDQFPGSLDTANLDGTFFSSQEVDVASQTSLSQAVLDGKVDVNEDNNELDSDNVAFVADTVPLDVPSRRHTGKESIDGGSWVNEQNNGPKLDPMPFVASTGPLDPLQPPTAFESIDTGAQVNENKPAVSLAEFLTTRNSRTCTNGTSEMCCSSNAAEILSFEKTLAGAGRHSNNISQLLVKKALEAVDEDESICSVPIGATFKGSSNAAHDYVAKWHSVNRIKAVSDKDCNMENTENSVNSVFSRCSATGSQKEMTENSNLDWSLGDILAEPNTEDSWSDLSNMESFSRARANESVVSANTAAGKNVEDLLVGTGVGSTVTQVAGEELQKVRDLLYEDMDEILGMASTEKGTSKSSPSLEVMLAESSDSETQTSDLEDIDNGAHIGSANLFGSFSSSDDGASVTTEPLVDVVDLPTESEAYASALKEPLVDVPTHSETTSGLNEPLVDMVDPLHPSETASGVNEPLVDVVDPPTLSETASGVNEPLVDVVDPLTLSETASGVNEPFANVDDLPKPLEKSAGGSRAEHPDSLI
ncbi:hypothetical protein EJB05_11745 [Eragrostis curvula]|uniref:Uncharacterized protein n=1 Tax=Eragrostis curvula TaxID=38414 RepID=A0A5J9VRC8_9POAL|nr:hypothetical protein EJB05_11745 [Eragrostis curvula]